MQFTTFEIVVLLFCAITLIVSVVTLITVLKRIITTERRTNFKGYCSISKALHSRKMTGRFSLNKDFTAFQPTMFKALKISDARLMKSLKV